MLPPVQQTLDSAVAVTAIVSNRIYQGIVPEGQNTSQADFIVWQMISNRADLNLSDLPEVDDQLVQVDCYSKSQTNARLLATVVRDTLEAQTHVVRGPEWSYEEDTKLHRYSMDAEYWNPRTAIPGPPQTSTATTSAISSSHGQLLFSVADGSIFSENDWIVCSDGTNQFVGQLIVISGNNLDVGTYYVLSGDPTLVPIGSDVSLLD